LIGSLQKINTTSHIGGELETTMLQTFIRSANIRRWMQKHNCPELILQLKHLFDKAFTTSKGGFKIESEAKEQAEHAYYTYQGVTFSRSRTHLGGSLVLFYPTPSCSEPVAGSIQKIVTRGNEPCFYIRRQRPLSPSAFDPFQRYTFFSARSYSSDMSSDPEDKVHPSSVLSHVARYNYSHKRAVILNLSR
ncbi:hypothetical protein EDD18DRAFT_1047902, partial [Armillaria luteobubalina]